MTDLIKKIVTRFTGDATLANVAGPYFGRQKEGASFPYAILMPITGSAVHVFAQGGTDFVVEDQVIQFSMYGTDLVTLSGYQEALHARFDKCTLTLTATGDTFLSALRETNSIFISPTLSSDAIAVYHAMTRYRFVWQNNL